ncbi:phosphate transport system substrate-binding protein [Meinhardsimonia xiamenensis]|jgi:phosphate transport system substrate-binding protein|uniref:Phosphate transport system substrate-binding protein n=1 Tax=Meinhardsimonia xiamenensis TaxID=990712 RepID=A0A1G9DVG6_9RHOB|nr:substrate-binding domain-containing protein [Meinhardsimonia xiamenensis]PRX31182.1 phosphate ABC transporter substrate-binding protein (PhoT family) [Meinhardsimonia xiamenensis]SDK67846.1 phosphate transport system substrate-binding protein [Meinhardsimonia xiamenensis]
MKMWRAAVLAAPFLVGWAWGVAAEDVTLMARDGSLEISGTVLGFDGEFYRLDTIYGELTVDGTAVSCSGPGCPDVAAYVPELRIAGARRMGAVLMPALIESFAARQGYRAALEIVSDTAFTYSLIEKATGRPAAHLHFDLSTTREGLARLLADEADLALALREPTLEEIAAHRAAGLGELDGHHRSVIIGLDALVPIVAPGNPVRRISMEDLARVFAGEVTDWKELGWPEGPIALHLGAVGAGSAELFEARVMARHGRRLSPAVERHASAEELADAVARDVFAIGIATASELGNARPMALAGGCGIFTAPDPVSVKTEDYPLTMPLFVYLPPRRLPLVMREFLRFARSPAAQAVIRRAGFVDLGLGRIGLERQGVRLANAISAAGEETPLSELQRLVWLMRGVERLTLAFRFRNGTAELDAQSRSNIELLADRLEAGEFDDHRLVFVGFSDGEGPAAANLALARRRAETVRDAVLRAAPLADRRRILTTVDAFGEAMPLACDDSEWGRAVNRRVEVWVAHR